MTLPAAASTPVDRGADTHDLRVRFDGAVPVLELPAHMAFEPLRSWLRAVLPAHLSSLGSQTCRLDFGTRDIVLLDLRRLVGFLRQEFGIEVTGLYVGGAVVSRFAERELKLKLFSTDAPTVADAAGDATPPAPEEPHVPEPAAPVEPVAPSAPAPLPGSLAQAPYDRGPERGYTPVPTPVRGDGGMRTLPLHRTLRSGSQVRFDGDVHVYGDVNPGAHVVATGNIVVFGALKGVAHAGAHGNERAFIVAFDMRPTQLRIARKIAIPSVSPASRDALAEVATLQGDQVVVAPFKGRIPADSRPSWS